MKLKILFMTVVFVAAPVMAFADELKIAVAANFLKTVETLSHNFKQQTGTVIKVSGGPTGKLYAQIANGAPFDIFFSADVKTPQRMESEGLIKAGSRFTYAQGRLALWGETMPEGAEAADILRKAEFNHLAMANPKAAPYGIVAEQTLDKLGVLDKLRPKFVTAENIGQTYQFVATGNAELGFVAYSYCIDPKHVNKGSYWLVPQSYHDPLDQDVVILKKAENSVMAQVFIDYVRSPEGKKVIEASGYSVP
jgi:molybdate transport system substrate-binding protein